MVYIYIYDIYIYIYIYLHFCRRIYGTVPSNGTIPSNGTVPLIESIFPAINKFALSLSPLEETEFARDQVNTFEWYEELLQRNHRFLLF